MSLFDGLEQCVKQDEPLANYTWFKLGGPAEYFFEPENEDQLKTIVVRCREQEVPVRMLGGGSNILVREEGVRGVVVLLKKSDFRKIEVNGNLIKASGGAKLGHVVACSVREGLAGLETLVGIPGSIGGALHGNAGARGGDIGQWTASARVMTRTGEIVERKRQDMFFRYRESSLDELVILSGEFQLEQESPELLTKRMQKQWIVKKAGQPMAHQSAGCIFKNPRGMSAGMLIEQASLKGARCGQAEVSDRHANFIIAGEDATSQDVINLIEHVRENVSQRLGVDFTTEIEIW